MAELPEALKAHRIRRWVRKGAAIVFLVMERKTKQAHMWQARLAETGAKNSTVLANIKGICTNINQKLEHSKTVTKRISDPEIT